MAENKTKPGTENIEKFLSSIPDQNKREDCMVLIEMMKKASGKDPVLWGGTMIGFGDYHYKYESGREGDIFMIGFAPRKQNLVIYNMGGFEEVEEMKKLGKHKMGKGCLYIDKLSDIDQPALKKLIEKSYKKMLKK